MDAQCVANVERLRRLDVGVGGSAHKRVHVQGMVVVLTEGRLAWQRHGQHELVRARLLVVGAAKGIPASGRVHCNEEFAYAAADGRA